MSCACELLLLFSVVMLLVEMWVDLTVMFLVEMWVDLTVGLGYTELFTNGGPVYDMSSACLISQEV